MSPLPDRPPTPGASTTGPLPDGPPPTRVVVTGAAGAIGTSLCAYLKASGRFDVVEIDLAGGPGVVEADVRRLDPLWTKELAGADAVVHLAHQRSSTIWWDQALVDDFDMVMNVYRAAEEQGVPRVVLASSIWTTYGRRFSDGDNPPDDPVDPGLSAYGMMKVFSERVARSFDEGAGISSVVLRIGSFVPNPLPPGDAGHSRWAQDGWLDPVDLHRGVERAIVAEQSGVTVVNLTSATPTGRWELRSAADRIGYVPAVSYEPSVPVRRRLQAAVSRAGHFRLPALVRRFVEPHW